MVAKSQGRRGQAGQGSTLGLANKGESFQWSEKSINEVDGPRHHVIGVSKGCLGKEAEIAQSQLDLGSTGSRGRPEGGK